MDGSCFEGVRFAIAPHGTGITPLSAGVVLAFKRGDGAFSVGKVSSAVSSARNSAALPLSLEGLRNFLKMSAFSEMLALATTASPSPRASAQRSKRRRLWAPVHSSFREDEEVCFFIWPKTSVPVPANAMGRLPHPETVWIWAILNKPACRQCLWRGAAFIVPALAYAPRIRNPASPSLRVKRSASKGIYSNAPQRMRRVPALGEGTRDEFFNQQ